jgi:hypothetical protein
MANKYIESYLIYSLIFLSLWSFIWLLSKDNRKRMLKISLILSPIGAISQFWYLNDYWHPKFSFQSFINIEDYIFTFALAGISFTIYKVVFKLGSNNQRCFKRRANMAFLFFGIVLLSLIFFSTYLNYNSVIVSSNAFFAIILIMWLLRPDLIFPSLISGFLTLLVFLIVYQLMFSLYPNFMDEWCFNCNPSGVSILGVNIEELIWDFSWGAIGGIIYEFISGKGLKKEGISRAEKKALENFDNYDKFLNTLRSNININNTYIDSTLSVLSLRIVRVISYYLSSKAGFPISDLYGFLIIASLPIVLDIPFSIINFNVSGIAFLWVIYYLLLSYFLYKFPQKAWIELMEVLDSIHRIIINNEDKNRLYGWLNNKLNLSIQFAWSFFVGLFALIILILISNYFKPFVEFGIASYAQVYLNAFFGTAAIYWLWHIPLFINELRKIKEIELLWYSPVDTPQISSLTVLLAKSAYYSLIGMCLTFFPLIYYINKLANSQFVLISSLIFVITSTTVLFISFFPQYWIIQIVKNSKESTLEKIRIEINQLSEESVDSIKLSKKILMYHAIRSSNMSILDYKSNINYGVALVLAFFPYIIDFIITLSSYF